jgi:hypothetical protein
MRGAVVVFDNILMRNMNIGKNRSVLGGSLGVHTRRRRRLSEFTVESERQDTHSKEIDGRRT